MRKVTINVKFRIALYLLYLTFSIQAQSTLFTTNSTEFDENRYKDIKGSPYILDDFSPATIYDNDGNPLKGLMVNYNAYDYGVEAKKDNRITIIDENSYPKVVITPKTKKKKDGPAEIVLVPSPQVNMKGSYVQELFYSEDVQVYKRFRVIQSENKAEAPGQTIVMKRFALKTEYLVSYNGVLKQVKSKIDDVSKVIGFPKELKSFGKKNKNKLKSDQDWIDLFNYYSTL